MREITRLNQEMGPISGESGSLKTALASGEKKDISADVCCGIAFVLFLILLASRWSYNYTARATYPEMTALRAEKMQLRE